MWGSPGKNTGMGCHSLIQGIFLTQGSNLGLLHSRQILCHLSHQGSLHMDYMCAYIVVKPLSHVGLFMVPWIVGCQAPLSTGFPRQKYWSGLPFTTAGDLSDPGIKPSSLASPALADRFFTTAPPAKPIVYNISRKVIFYSLPYLI